MPDIFFQKFRHDKLVCGFKNEVRSSNNSIILVEPWQ